MSERGGLCPRCGQKVSPTTGECLLCDPAEPAPAGVVPAAGGLEPARPGPAAAPTPAGSGQEAERSFGLLLFEAEESLARAHPDRSLVLASRAVKLRPDSLTARALYERARREVLRGRRLERLEARIQSGHRLLEEGRYAEAERIVVSALKLVPDHAVAQSLLARLKERRLGASTAEAEADRELERLAQGHARRAVAAARAALASGWNTKALAAVRRGLHACPDHAELLELLRQAQGAGDHLDRESAHRRARLSQVRAATELVPQGRLEEARTILRAVLREEPDDARAQAAMQEVRRAWLERGSVTAPRAALAPTPAPSAPPPVAVAHEGSGLRTGAAPPTAAPAPPAAPADNVWERLAAAHAARPAGAPSSPRRPQAPRPEAIPPEILLPRTRRRTTPLVLVLAAAAVALTAVFVFVARPGGRGARRVPAAAPAPVLPASPAAPPAPAAPGPLEALDEALRGAIEATLADYARALEAQDAERLARARPDLSAQERERLLARFAGALNVAVDLRVLDVVPAAGSVAVPVLRTDVIVGGGAEARAPVEEVLRFVHRRGSWALDDGR